MADLTQTLAAYIHSSRFENLPPEAAKEGLRAFVHWVGCAAAGARSEAITRTIEVLTEFNGAKNTTLIGRPEKLDSLNAAYINSQSSCALFFNDTHLATVAHPTGPVAAALLALAEQRPLSGSEFLHALVLGIEIQCRVGNILTAPPAECAVGLSMVGLVGAIGAAVAVSKVLGFDAGLIATAIGLAANQAGGLRQTQTSMATTQPSGHSARCGLLAALLAAKGFTCSGHMIDGANGFGVSYAHQPNYDAALNGLGKTFETTRLSYKPYPCGVVSHPAIDACLEIAQRKDFDYKKVDRVELSVNDIVMKLMDRPDPANATEATFSIQHWAAAALVYKKAGIAQTTMEAAGNPEVDALRRRIALKPGNAVARSAASARVMLNSGETLSADVAHCRGSEKRPMSDDDISEKTRAQLAFAYPEPQVEKILAACWALQGCTRAGDLCTFLGAAA